MDMPTRYAEQQLFFSTGKRADDGLEAIDGLKLRPALFARYRDLTRLRYDYPVVLVQRGPRAGEACSLSSVVDEVLQETAPRGIEGERLRRHALQLEREIRTLVQRGTSGDLSEVWREAATRIQTPGDASSTEVLGHLADKLTLSGPLADCDAALPGRYLAHLWQAALARKAQAFRTTVGRLIVRLSDILRAAFLHSQAGQQPEALRMALGGGHRDAFDFDVMSRLLVRSTPRDELSSGRRARIEAVLEALRNQPFYPDPLLGDSAATTERYAFGFDNCQAAAEAFRARLPRLVDVVKAIAIGELEVDGRYDEATHDPFFAQFDETALSADDLAMFPDYLVVIPPGRNDAPENAALMEMLSSGLPVKVLVETTDLLEEAAVGTGHFAFGVRSARLANIATALGGVFVVQCASSHLHAMRERLERAFAHRGAGLVSVYTGAASETELPLYLVAAAAMESRAFPAFVYDPGGENLAARFALADNPQPEADWPVAELEYADADLQRITEETPFTVADFVLCDPRYAAHFARVPRERWNAALVPADAWLARDPKAASEAIPYVLAVDGEDRLQRLIVDARLMAIAARCRTFWRRLQEQGGIHNSHAEILLAREKAQWEAAKERELAELRAAASASVATPNGAAAVAAAEAEASAAQPEAPKAAAREGSADEAWIETARCPSCNECQNINDRMFKYNENKQAFIADITAGTYRQLVEAAEACQVAIIHPGKPRDPNEPGLAELLERAKPFL